MGGGFFVYCIQKKKKKKKSDYLKITLIPEILFKGDHPVRGDAFGKRKGGRIKLPHLWVTRGEGTVSYLRSEPNFTPHDLVLQTKSDSGLDTGPSDKS